MNIKVTLVEFMGDRTVSSKRLWDVAEGQICMNVQNVHHVNAKDHFWCDLSVPELVQRCAETSPKTKRGKGFALQEEFCDFGGG